MFQGKSFESQFEFAEDSQSIGSKIILSFGQLIQLLLDKYKGLSNFNVNLQLYMLLLKHVFLFQRSTQDADFDFDDFVSPDDRKDFSSLFDFPNINEEPASKRSSVMADIESQRTSSLQTCFKQNILVPANEYELHIRLHWLIKFLTNVRTHFVEGQKRTTAAILNSIGLNLCAFGYESFAFPAPQHRLQRIIQVDKVKVFKKIFKEDLGTSFFRHSGSSCPYIFYALATEEARELKKPEVVCLHAKSLKLVQQSALAQNKSISDLFAGLIRYLLSHHDEEIDPFVVFDSNTRKRQKLDDGMAAPRSEFLDRYIMKEMDLFKRHYSHLIFNTLHRPEFRFPSITEFLVIFREYVHSEYKGDKKKKGKPDKMKMADALSAGPDAATKDSSKRVAIDDSQSKAMKEWLDPETYPLVERALHYQFPDKDTNVGSFSQEVYAFLGFHPKAGNFIAKTYNFSSETPLIWQDFIAFLVLTVHNSSSACDVIHMIENRGKRYDEFFPQDSFVYMRNATGQAVPYKVQVSFGFIFLIQSGKFLLQTFTKILFSNTPS